MRLQQFRSWARRYLYPPAGREVRRLVALITLAVGLPRLPLLADVLVFTPQRFGQHEAYGIASIIVGMLLLATSSRWRLALVGRLVAVAGVVLWATLAAATVSTTSLLIDLAVAASLLMETGTLRRSHE